jgi:hypothetical protein
MSGMTICADGMENPARSDYQTAGILVSRIQLEGYSLERKTASSSCETSVKVGIGLERG